MKGLRFFLLGSFFLLLLGACAPPTIVKVQPPDYAPTFNVVSGKLSQDLGIKTALLAPQGEIKTLPLLRPQPLPQSGLLGLLIQPQQQKALKPESL